MVCNISVHRCTTNTIVAWNKAFGIIEWLSCYKYTSVCILVAWNIALPHVFTQGGEHGSRLKIVQ